MNRINGDATNNTLQGADNQHNLINGEAGDDVLIGANLADWLNGGTGADTLIGGLGNDRYRVNDPGDIVQEASTAVGEIDRVWAPVSFTLSANVENMVLVGTDSIQGEGNSLNNQILGNSAANVLQGNDGSDTLGGGHGDDTLIGGQGNDSLNGSLGADVLMGGDGNDRYRVDNAADMVSESSTSASEIDRVWASVSFTLSANVENMVLVGTAAIQGEGNNLDNRILGNGAANVLTGADGNDTLGGGQGDDTLVGGQGNDSLNGSYGVDVLMGGDGNDQYRVDNVADMVSESSIVVGEIDAVWSSVSYTLSANVENMTLVGTADVDGTGNNLANFVRGNSASNQLNGAAGDDSLNAGAGEDTLLGGEGNDSLSGDDGTDMLSGDAGNDTLNGGAGVDTLSGGAGDDVYMVDGRTDVIDELTSEGTDTVYSSMGYTLGANVEHLVLTGYNTRGTGNSLNNRIEGSYYAYNQLDGGTGQDTLVGGFFSDTFIVDDSGDVVIDINSDYPDTVISSVSYTLSAGVDNLTLTDTANLTGMGNSVANVLTGNSGDNVLTGEEGNDTLDGGDGADTLIGGVGDDVYVVNSVTDVISEMAGEGTDTLIISSSYTLDENFENLTLTGTANLTGMGNSSANVLTGNRGNNVLMGNGGNDTLDGGVGADTLVGGVGDDVYLVDNLNDVIDELANEGTDTVNSSVNYTLGATVEHLVLTSLYSDHGTGNSLNNRIVGGSNNNYLDGGAGQDTLIGGKNEDTFIVDDSGDVVLDVDANDWEQDTIISSVSYTLGANVEVLTLTGTAGLNGRGNSLNNLLMGNSGDNVLIGEAGHDRLEGGDGADTLVGDAGRDRLEGGDGADSLAGGEGDDWLEGGDGADTLAGGAGKDVYVVNSVTDVISEMVGEGNDTLIISFSYTLDENFENLTLTGTANLTGMGNSADNVLTGNSGDNVLTGEAGDDRLYGGDGADSLVGGAGNSRLDGGIGADTLVGGVGDDVYVIDSIMDVFSEEADAGRDWVYSSISYTLGANVERLMQTGTANLTGMGNSLANWLSGNSGNNLLEGGAGDDTLVGGQGNDTLIGGAGADSMDGGGGDDVYMIDDTTDRISPSSPGLGSVISSVSYTLNVRLKNLTLTGTSNLTGMGNIHANVLTGNSGDNVLTGGGSDDTLIGGLGNDTYHIARREGVDTLVENDASVGNNDILSFASGVAHDQLWFRHVGNNLEVSIIGTFVKMVVTDWYSGTAQHVEQIITVDGNKILRDTEVENLVTAMASMTPPPLEQTSLTAAEHAKLDAVIAASWS